MKGAFRFSLSALGKSVAFSCVALAVVQQSMAGNFRGSPGLAVAASILACGCVGAAIGSLARSISVGVCVAVSLMLVFAASLVYIAGKLCWF